MLAAVILSAAMLRFASLGQVPAGLYRDEAFYGTGRAQRLAWPARDLLCREQWPRADVHLPPRRFQSARWGAAHSPARPAGRAHQPADDPATFLMARELWGRRVGLLSAAVLAVTLWPVHLAHIGFRVGLLPLFAALTAWQVARGWRTPAHAALGRSRNFVRPQFSTRTWPCALHQH